MASRDKRVKLQSGRDALLLIDVLNDLEFPGGEKVLPWAERLVMPLERLCEKCRQSGVPVIYVNDNYGIWTGDRGNILAHCTRHGARGRRVSRRLGPRVAVTR